MIKSSRSRRLTNGVRENAGAQKAAGRTQRGCVARSEAGIATPLTSCGKRRFRCDSGTTAPPKIGEVELAVASNPPRLHIRVERPAGHQSLEPRVVLVEFAQPR